MEEVLRAAVWLAVLRDGSPSVLDLGLRISARTAGMVRVGDECNVKGWVCTNCSCLDGLGWVRA